MNWIYGITEAGKQGAESNLRIKGSTRPVGIRVYLLPNSRRLITSGLIIF